MENKIKSCNMCRLVNANLPVGLSPSPSSPDTKEGRFPLGFSSPDDFTRAHREACSEANKRSSESPFTGSSKVSAGQGCAAKPPPWGQGASVKPRRPADGPTAGDQATSQPEGQEHTKNHTVAPPEDRGPAGLLRGAERAKDMRAGAHGA